MTTALSIKDIPSAAEYARIRDDFRARLIGHKKARTVAIGENVTLLFESRDTVLYQVLEMLRIEKTADPEGIQAELDAYNPLIPGGADWRATMLIEFPDAAERQVQLKYLRSVEHAVHARIGDEKIVAMADEDMERSDDEKTSAVHFLRFPLTAQHIAALRAGAELVFGIDHPRYRFESAAAADATRESLRADLD